MAGIIIVAHTPVASAMYGFAEHIFGKSPDRVRAIDIPPHEDTKTSFERVLQAANEVDGGNGVLVLTRGIRTTPQSDCFNRLKSSDVDALHFASGG